MEAVREQEWLDLRKGTEEARMENRKTVFDYLGQMLIVFGFSTVVLDVFCLLIGEDAQRISTIYSLGKEGISVAASLQFLGVSACITGFRFVFFTDGIIRQMSVVMRTVCMFVSIIILIAVCAVLFDWFPVDMWQPWAAFLLTFAFCSAASLLLMALKEKAENRKMEEALNRIKQEQENKNS